MMTVATKPAPLQTPMTPGSARGFFMTAWNKVPDTASAAPANGDDDAGKSKIIDGRHRLIVCHNSPFQSLAMLTFKLPRFTERKNMTTKSRAVMIKAAAVTRRFFSFVQLFLIIARFLTVKIRLQLLQRIRQLNLALIPKFS